jgi:hypothetical protein
MGSGFDDWVYCHIYTITVDYNSSHTELLLNDVCLANLLTNLGLISTALLISFVLQFRVRVTLRLVVYRQSVRLGAEPLETNGQNFFSPLNTCGLSLYIISSLTRLCVYYLNSRIHCLL